MSAGSVRTPVGPDGGLEERSEVGPLNTVDRPQTSSV